MLEKVIPILLLLQLASLIGCEAPTESPTPLSSPDEVVAAEGPLPFEVVEQKRVKKGGSLNPPGTDTVLAVQVSDNARNLGPPVEIVVRVD